MKNKELVKNSEQVHFTSFFTKDSTWTLHIMLNFYFFWDISISEGNKQDFKLYLPICAMV